MEKPQINKDKAQKIFINKNGVLYPYVEFTNFPFDKIVEEVMISPYNNSELAVIGLKEFLREHNLEHIKIEKSKIRIR